MSLRTPGRRRRGAAAGVILLLLLPACAALGPGHSDPRAMTFTPVRLAPPVPQRHILGNGLVVFLLEDHELPLVEGRAIIRTGSVFDPPGKTGLARLCGQLLVSGGIEEFPGGQLDEVLDSRAINLVGEISSQSGNVSFSALAADADRALSLFAGVLRRPAFDPDKVEVGRKRAEEEILRTADSPDSLASREFKRFFYGRDPRGRAATVEEIRGIGRSDLVDFHREWFLPDRILLGFAGDFESRALLERIEALFGDWPASGHPAPALPVPDPATSDRSINLIDKDLPQATILVGQFAPPKDSPEYVPFLLVDYILGGGGFNSRLTREIRSDRGLAYSVGSYYRGDVGYGVFVESCKTKNESAVEAFDLMRELTSGAAAQGVTEEELAWARESLVNGMIFSYASTAAVLGEALGLEYDRLPPDFAARVKQRIETVSLAEVRGAARRHLDPEAATVTVLGRQSDVRGSWPAGRHVKRYRVTAEGKVF